MAHLTYRRSILLNEQCSNTQLVNISDQLYVLSQALGRAIHDVHNDHGISDALRAIVAELEAKSERAKAMIYRRDPQAIGEALAELSEAAHCARMTALAEKNARAETVASVSVIPDCIAALRDSNRLHR